MEQLLAVFQDEPIGAFALLLAVSLIVPPLFERLRLPGVLGLLTAGVVLGQNGLGLLAAESPIMELLADVGLLYLMFVAGLEIDLVQLRKVKHRSAGFGALTFFCPLLTGTLIGRWFQFDWNAAILLGSLLASHSLMTYPIVRRLGVVTNEAVTVTIGATICTDIGALIVLAICLGIHTGGFSVAKLLTLLILLSLYTLLVLVGIDRIGRDFFRRSGGDEGNQFLFVLLAVFIAALGAQLIGVEKIVGAFLSGLAVNDVVGDGPVKEKVVFVGSVLFIPIFFVNIGLLIDLPAFVSSLSAFWLALSIVGGLMGSKLLAAFLAKVSFRYSWREMLTMWSMSIPQVATTLAATLVGNRVGMLSDEVLNSVVVMMLVTATIGPLIVSRCAVGLPVPAHSQDSREDHDFSLDKAQPQPLTFTVVVPIHNPRTEQYLIELAALLARRQGGYIVPLVITLARPHMNQRHLAKAMLQSERLLKKAEKFSQTFDIPVKPLLRIDDQVPLGIYRASQEQRADLIVMGWGNTTSLRARLFGNTVDSVFGTSPCPVAVARLQQSPQLLSRILVPVENFSERSLRMVMFARLLVESIQAEMTLLHILGPAERLEWAQAETRTLIERAQFSVPVQTRLVQGDDIVRLILRESQTFDLVILHSQRHQTAAEGFGFSSITSQVLKQLGCSTIVLGEAHMSYAAVS
jgi:Kef-type K+ transport system membrane component KefB/nucleotide-binding universal stress UspA family protein